MGFGSGTSLTYKEVAYSALVSPRAIARGSGDTKLALVHDSAAVYVPKGFSSVTDAWLLAQALERGCSSSAL